MVNSSKKFLIQTLAIITAIIIGVCIALHLYINNKEIVYKKWKEGDQLPYSGKLTRYSYTVGFDELAFVYNTHTQQYRLYKESEQIHRSHTDTGKRTKVIIVDASMGRHSYHSHYEEEKNGRHFTKTIYFSFVLGINPSENLAGELSHLVNDVPLKAMAYSEKIALYQLSMKDIFKNKVVPKLDEALHAMEHHESADKKLIGKKWIYRDKIKNCCGHYVKVSE